MCSRSSFRLLLLSLFATVVSYVAWTLVRAAVRGALRRLLRHW